MFRSMDSVAGCTSAYGSIAAGAAGAAFLSAACNVRTAASAATVHREAVLGSIRLAPMGKSENSRCWHCRAWPRTCARWPAIGILDSRAYDFRDRTPAETLRIRRCLLYNEIRRGHAATL